MALETPIKYPDGESGQQYLRVGAVQIGDHRVTLALELYRSQAARDRYKALIAAFYRDLDDLKAYAQLSEEDRETARRPSEPQRPDQQQFLQVLPLEIPIASALDALGDRADDVAALVANGSSYGEAVAAICAACCYDFLKSDAFTQALLLTQFRLDIGKAVDV